MIEGDYGCFENDRSSIPVDIRRVAVKLKKGKTVDYQNPKEFDFLLKHTDQIEESLNGDFLKLYVDEENRVAWAETAGEDEPSLLAKPTLQENDVAIFLAIASALIERRQNGYDKPEQFIATTTDLKNRFIDMNAKFDGDGRGDVIKAFDAAMRRATTWQWVSPTDDTKTKYYLTRHVMALIKRGFVGELLAAMKETVSTDIEGTQTEEEAVNA